MPDGRTRRVTVGAVGEFERVEDARRKAGGILGGLREGIEPKAERRKAAARDKTLRQWLDAYLIGNTRLAERSRDGYRRCVERYLKAWLDRPLRTLSREMVEERHRNIATETAKPGRSGGGENTGRATADGTMAALRAIYNFAIDHDESLPSNPVRLRQQWFGVAPRERFLNGDQLPIFYAALDGLENNIQADFLRVVLFTGLRRASAGALRWDQVDFASRVIRLPAKQLKGGKRRLDLPMTDYLRDLLVARRALGDDGGWVFPANSESGHLEEPAFALGEVAKTTAIAGAKAAGVEIDDDDDVPQEVINKYGVVVSCHDLRRTFITVAEATDISPLALKALVNHAVGGDVTANYVRMTVERLREPAQRVAERLAQLCGIEEPAGENVERIGDRA